MIQFWLNLEISCARIFLFIYDNGILWLNKWLIFDQFKKKLFIFEWLMRPFRLSNKWSCFARVTVVLPGLWLFYFSGAIRFQMGRYRCPCGWPLTWFLQIFFPGTFLSRQYTEDHWWSSDRIWLFWSYRFGCSLSWNPVIYMANGWFRLWIIHSIYLIREPTGGGRKPCRLFPFEGESCLGRRGLWCRGTICSRLLPTLKRFPHFLWDVLLV